MMGSLCNQWQFAAAHARKKCQFCSTPGCTKCADFGCAVYIFAFHTVFKAHGIVELMSLCACAVAVALLALRAHTLLWRPLRRSTRDRQRNFWTLKTCFRSPFCYDLLQDLAMACDINTFRKIRAALSILNLKPSEGAKIGEACRANRKCVKINGGSGEMEGRGWP